MKHLITVLTLAAAAVFATPALAANAECVAKADKPASGKPLAGAARTSFLKKCEADAGPAPSAAKADCEAKAVDGKGKPLAGAAKNSFVKKCEKDGAGGGDAKAACEAKAVDGKGKPLAGAAKNSSVKKCLADAKA